MLGFHTNPLLLQASDNVHLVHVLFQVAGQDIQIVFRDCQAAMPQYLLERHHGAAHGCPFLGKRMPKTVNAGLLQPSFVAIVPNGMVAAASRELLSVHRTEKPIIGHAATILQVLL